MSHSSILSQDSFVILSKPDSPMTTSGQELCRSTTSTRPCSSASSSVGFTYPCSTTSLRQMDSDSMANSIASRKSNNSAASNKSDNKPTGLVTPPELVAKFSYDDNVQVGSLPNSVNGQSIPLEQDAERKFKSLEVEKGIALGRAMLVESITSLAPESSDEEDDDDNQGNKQQVKEPSLSTPFVSINQPLNGASMQAFESYLRAVREENEKLKEILEGNNDAMKRQLKVVQSWQEEVTTGRKTIIEIKDQSAETIAKLESEKDALKADLDLLRDSSGQYDVEVDHLKAENDLLKGEAAQLKGQVEGLTSSNDHLKEEINKLGDKLKLAMEAAQRNESGSFFWDNMSLELGELRSRLDQVPLLEAALQEKDETMAKMTEKLAKTREELQQLNLEVAELKLAKLKDEDLVPLLKNQLEIYSADFKVEEDARKMAEVEVRRLEFEMALVKQESQELRARLELGAPTVNLGGQSGATMSNASSYAFISNTTGQPLVDDEEDDDENLEVRDDGHRHHRHHRKLLKKLHKRGRHYLPVLNSGLNLEAYRQYRAT